MKKKIKVRCPRCNKESVVEEGYVLYCNKCNTAMRKKNKKRYK